MRCIAIALLVAAAAYAQPAPGVERPKQKRVMVEVKHLNSERLQNVLSAFGVAVQPDPSGRFIVLRGSDEDVSAAQDAIRRLDLPPRNIELTFHIITASSSPANDPVPSEIEPVVKQLRSAFPQYKSFQLLETALTRVSDAGFAEISGNLPGSNGTYQIRAARVRVTPGAPNTVSIEKLNMGGRFEKRSVVDGKTNAYFSETGINTNVDFKEGQKLVVGKATMGDQAAFWVITGRVID